VVSSSRAALRLTELARAQGKHAAAHDRLMQAYWEEGLDIGDLDVLRQLAAELELDSAEDAISGDLYGDQVATGTSRAHSIGIDAIPAFLLDRRLVVLGAQPDDVFEHAFARLAASADRSTG
jgi:predicted DsbA family dithiol-disulfide isomerase